MTDWDYAMGSKQAHPRPYSGSLDRWCVERPIQPWTREDGRFPGVCPYWAGHSARDIAHWLDSCRFVVLIQEAKNQGSASTSLGQ